MPVAAVRERGLGRGVRDLLVDRRAAAAARRELAGRLLLAALVWRNEWMSSMINMAAACWSWYLSIMNRAPSRSTWLGPARSTCSC